MNAVVYDREGWSLGDAFGPRSHPSGRTAISVAFRRLRASIAIAATVATIYVLLAGAMVLA